MKMGRRMLKALLIAVLVAEIGLILSPASIAASTEKTLYKFKGGTADGANPRSGLILLSDGSLLGTAYTAGGGCPGLSPVGCGVLFQLLPPSPGSTSWTEKVLYRFSKSESFSPYGLTQTQSGAIYGVAGAGLLGGTIFKVEPPKDANSGWTVTTIFQFGDNAGGLGSYPASTVVEDASGNLYGTADGGSTCGYLPPSASIPFPTAISCGIVYKLSPPSGSNSAWTETVIYSFKGNSNDGDLPGNLVMGPSGELYGVTTAGGKGCTYTANVQFYQERGCGTVFKVSPPAPGTSKWTESIIHFFEGPQSDGAHPIGDLNLAADGSLYGTTVSGYAGEDGGVLFGGGGVFKLTPPVSGKGSWTETTLWRFIPHDVKGEIDYDLGYEPDSKLILGRSGVLYGTTTAGSGPTTEVVFALHPPVKGAKNWTETILHAFPNSNSFELPSPNMTFDNKTGNLFGVSPFLGGKGLVFEVTP